MRRLILGITVFIIGAVTLSGFYGRSDLVAQPKRLKKLSPDYLAESLLPKKLVRAPAHQNTSKSAITLKTLDAAEKVDILLGIMRRKGPEQAQIVDDVVDYMKRDSDELFSVKNIPADKNGVSVLTEKTVSMMIRDEDFRPKWKAFMSLYIETSKELELVNGNR